MLTSDVPDTEGSDSAALPKVMACRGSFIYLEMPLLYQRILVSEHSLDAW